MASKKVNTTHPDYDRMVDKWSRVRACVAGQDAVHDAGERFLPSLKDQEAAEYNKYKLRADFFNSTWRIISALSGLLFRKPPVITVPAAVEPLLEDVTMSGISLHVFVQNVAIEALTTGRIGILVDYPPQSVDGLSLAEAQKLNLRPAMQKYPAESIVNWKTQWIGNKTVLSMVVLSESTALPGDSEFEQKTETRYRVLDLFNNRYRVRVFRIDDNKEDEQVGTDLFPLMNGKPLDFIPFIFLGVDDTTPDVDDPPLIDLVDLNLSHYRLDADLKHGLHFTGLPQPWIAGYSPENNGEKLYIGSSYAWTFPDPQTRAAYLEFGGQGLGPISEEKEKIEQRMAILGARLLSAEKKAVETAQTAQIHRAGENSILSAIAQTISIGMTTALRVFCQWAGSEEQDTGIELNREFMPPEMSPQELTSLVSAWQAGAFSMQVLFDQLQKVEIISTDLDLETMQEQIGSSPVPKPDMTGAMNE